MMISIEPSHGCYLLTNDQDSRDILIQTDFDFPGVARTFGWSPCHSGTDGTVDCPSCKRTASQLISEAAEYLDNNPDPVEDPGYFNQED